jgi:hypothetical protein
VDGEHGGCENERASDQRGERAPDGPEGAIYGALNDLAASIAAADMLRSSWTKLAEVERHELLDMILRRNQGAASLLQEELARAHPPGARIGFPALPEDPLGVEASR